MTAAFWLAVLIHGPLDITITAIAYELETNPIVLELGLGSWAAIKVGLLLILILIWFDAPLSNPKPWVSEATVGFGVIAGFGLALVFLNAVWVWGVVF